MKNFNTTKIKSLSTQIEKFKLELSVKENQLRLMQEEYKGKQEHLKRLTDELESLKQSSSELIISEHAILRYLERVYKLDLEKLSQEIVPQTLKTTIKELGNGEYHTSDGYSLKVQDNVVVTILDEEMKHPSKKPLKSKKKKPNYEPSLKEQLKDIA